MSSAFPTDMSQVTGETLARYQKLIRRAQRGDENAMSEVQPLVDSPNALATFGGLADVVGKALARMAAGDNLIRRKLNTREMDQWRDELLGPAPTTLERMLVEQVVFGRVQLLDAQIKLAGCRPRDRDYHQRQVDRAHRRFLATQRALDTLRKKVVPAVQVNIARKQVNVAPRAALIREGEAPAEPDALPVRQEPCPPEWNHAPPAIAESPRLPPMIQITVTLPPRSTADCTAEAAPAHVQFEAEQVMLRPSKLRRFGAGPLARKAAGAPPANRRSAHPICPSTGEHFDAARSASSLYTGLRGGAQVSKRNCRPPPYIHTD